MPAQVTSDGHDSCLGAIRSELGKKVRHRTGAYLNDRLEQDHRRVKGRYRPMRGFGSVTSADRFCRGHDEPRSSPRARTRCHQHVPVERRRLTHPRRTVTVLAIMGAA